MYTRLRDLREDKDISQSKCAKIAYISKNSYIRYENGERVPPFDVIVAYAKYYQVSIDYIAGLTNDKRGIGYADSYKHYEQHNNGIAVMNIRNDDPE